MGAGDAVILVTNSNVKHALTGSEYPTRVAQCKAATEAIAKFTASEVTQLRDASLQMLDEAAANSAAEATKAAAKAAAEGIEGGAGSEEEETNNVLATSGDVYKRARHVISENARVLSATAALEAGDFEAVGEAMYKSHASLKDDFEVGLVRGLHLKGRGGVVLITLRCWIMHGCSWNHGLLTVLCVHGGLFEACFPIFSCLPCRMAF